MLDNYWFIQSQKKSFFIAEKADVTINIAYGQQENK